MLKQAWWFVTCRKKQAAFLVCILALVTFLMLSISPMFSALSESTFYTYAEEFGLHHCIYYDLTEAQWETLRGISTVKEAGVITNFGNYALSGTKVRITLGSFDETALTLSKVKLREGRFPKQPGEAAVEAHVLYQLPAGAGLGTKFTVEGADGTAEYTICGVVEDYRSKWSVPSMIKPGVNDLPAAFVAAGADWMPAPVKSAMVYFHTVTAEEEPFRLEADVYHAQLKGHENGDFLFVDNSNLYQHQQSRMYFSNWYRKYFVLLALAGAGLILMVALFGYDRNFDAAAYTLYTTGAPRREVRRLFYLIHLLLAALGVAAGMALCGVFVPIARAALGYDFSVFSYLWRAGIPVLLTLGVAAAYDLCVLRRQYGCDFSHREDTRRKKKQEAAEELPLGRRLGLALAARHVEQNWRRLTAAMLVGVVLAVMLFCMQAERAESYGSWVREVPTLSAQAAEQWSCLDYGTYRVNGVYQFFDDDRVRALRDLPGVTELYRSYEQEVNLQVPRGLGEYWELFFQNNQTPIMGYEASEVPAIPQDVRSTAFGFGFVVLDEVEQEWLQRAYPDLPVESLLSDGQVILFCPPIDQVRELDGNRVQFGSRISEITDGVTRNETVKAGDSLTLSWLDASPYLLDEVKDRTDRIRFCEQELPLSAVVNEGFYMERPYSIDDEPDGLTIVLSEETMRSLPFFQGMFTFRVTMDPGISDAGYAAVEEAFCRAAYAIEGANLYSSREEEALLDKVQRTVRLSYGILAVTLGGFVLISLFSVLYGTLLQRQRMFGILRAAGYRKRQMYGCILTELAVYWLGASLTCLMATLFGVYSFMANVVGVYLNAADLWPQAAKAGLFSAGLAAVLVVLAWVLTEAVWKRSISESIRFAE